MNNVTKEVDGTTVEILDHRVMAIRRKFIYLWDELERRPDVVTKIISGLDEFVSWQLAVLATTQANDPPKPKLAGQQRAMSVRRPSRGALS